MRQTGNDSGVARIIDVEPEQQDEDIDDGMFRPIQGTGRRDDQENETLHIVKGFKHYFVSLQGAVEWQTKPVFGQAC